VRPDFFFPFLSERGFYFVRVWKEWDAAATMVACDEVVEVMGVVVAVGWNRKMIVNW